MLTPGNRYVLAAETLGVHVLEDGTSGSPLMLPKGSECTLLSCEQFSGKLAAIEYAHQTYLVPARALAVRSSRNRRRAEDEGERQQLDRAS